MNVLFLTLLDFQTIDESGIYTDLLREFVRNGHNIHVVSPCERRKKEKTRLIKLHNAIILKLKIGNLQKTNSIEKGISTITLESRFRAGIKKHFRRVKFDLVLYSTPPITLLKPILYIKRRDGAKTYLLLKDIFPQNAVDLGMLKTNGFRSVLYQFFREKEKKLYSVSDFIGCMSEANVKYLLSHNQFIDETKVEVCPNSIEVKELITNQDKKTEIRRKYCIPADKVVFVYGGNLGKPQGISFLIDCIRANEANQFSFILVVGNGTEFSKLNLFFEKESLNNALLIRELPRDEYDLLVSACDVGLIFLDHRFTIPNFPSRLLSYMQASMPVLAATDNRTDLGRVIVNGGFGLWCESNRPSDFFACVGVLCNSEKRIMMGLKSKQYLLEKYSSLVSYKIIISHFNYQL